jgi:hypothetical protein
MSKFVKLVYIMIISLSIFIVSKNVDAYSKSFFYPFLFSFFFLTQYIIFHFSYIILFSYFIIENFVFVEDSDYGKQYCCNTFQPRFLNLLFSCVKNLLSD